MGQILDIDVDQQDGYVFLMPYTPKGHRWFAMNLSDLEDRRHGPAIIVDNEEAPLMLKAIARAGLFAR